MKQIVYAPNSRQAEMLRLGISMQADRSGTAFVGALGSDANPPQKKQKLFHDLADTASSVIGPDTQVCLATDTTQCHKTCYRHEDCDLSKDYICALKGDVDKPINPSWGRFQCTWVANAAVIVGAVLKYRDCKTGRCLLEADGNVIIPDKSKQAFEKTGNASELSNAFETDRKLPNETLLSSTSSLDLPTNVTLPFSPSEELNSTKANSSELTYAPTYNFFCLCNCTYVSRACCLSSIVYEDRIFQVNMSSTPPDQSLRCDLTSGEWVPIANTTNPPLGTHSLPEVNGTESAIPRDLQLDSNKSDDAVASTAESLLPTKVTQTQSSSGSVANSAPASSQTHHQCSGQCTQTSRKCSWGFTGDCACNAPRLDFGAIFFWWQWPCVATASNPYHTNTDNDKRRRIVEAGLESRAGISLGARGPPLDPSREAGVCNGSYISYACANASDGIVHESLTNWLGALLPVGDRRYPPVPREFLDVHGIKGEVDFGDIKPLY